LAKLFVIIGIVFIVAFVFHTNLFKLPGDIVIKKDNFTIYFPITTSIIISIILTLIFWKLK